jgi:hypothetical protein
VPASHVAVENYLYTQIFQIHKYFKFVKFSNYLRHVLLFHNDAHNYKITGILKQLKFRRSLQHVSVHVGTIIREPFLCLTKTTVMILYPHRSWRGKYHGSIPACCAGVKFVGFPARKSIYEFLNFNLFLYKIHEFYFRTSKEILHLLFKKLDVSD